MSDVLANLETRMNYIADRQQVLTQNIANADTPGFRAMELTAPKFSDNLASVAPVQMISTSPMHLSGTLASSGHGTLVVNRTPGAVSPTGNTVDIEDETRKAAENAMDYQLATNVYKSIGGLVLKAAGKAG